MKCKNCGHELDENLRYCKHCGTPVDMGDHEKKKNFFLSGKIQQNYFTILAVLGMMIVGVGIGFCIKTVGARVGAAKSKEISQEATVATTEDLTAADYVKAEKEETATETEAVEEESTEEDTVKEQTQEETTELVSEAASEETQTEEVQTEPAQRVMMSAVVSVRATSSLSEYNMTHSPDRLCDGSLSAAWVEGGAGQGIGESVTFEFDDIYEISGFIINAGYQKSADLYQKNSRPAQLTVSLPDGSEEVYFLEDIFGTQNIPLNDPVITDEITFTIKSVYPGNKYEDTVISELTLY